jgi:hypothetical protein
MFPFPLNQSDLCLGIGLDAARAPGRAFLNQPRLAFIHCRNKLLIPFKLPMNVGRRMFPFNIWYQIPEIPLGVGLARGSIHDLLGGSSLLGVDPCDLQKVSLRERPP